MNPSPFPKMRRQLTLTAAGLLSLSAASCSLPTKEEWKQIRERGLIPVLIEANRKPETAANPAVKPSEQDAVRVQPVMTPTVVKTAYASAVPGRTGYVFSPHTTPQKVVDVRGFQMGEEVRCPFTGQPFLVPDFKAVAAASKPTTEIAPVRRKPVTQVVSNAPAPVPQPDPGMERLEPAPAPQAPAPPPPAPSTTPSAPSSDTKANIPYGTRVAGRPGFVYSPFAARTQLVDVAGTAPGVVVKCPYTNKLFRVPEPISEEVKPQTPPAPTPAPAPAEPKESTPPAPAPGPQ